MKHTATRDSAQTIFTADTNEHLFHRAFWRVDDPQLGVAPKVGFAVVVPPGGEGETVDEQASRAVAQLYVGPGQVVPKALRRTAQNIKHQIASRVPLRFGRLEIEFSATPRKSFPGCNGLPEDFKNSAVRWALELCPAVVLLVDWQPGTEAGEPAHVAGECQASFRCLPGQVGVWQEYLTRRLRPRQTLTIVHGAAGGA